MKKFIETIKNIFRIEDLRKRILYTLFIILIYRFGAHVVLPGINPGALSAFSSAAQKGLLGMLDLFSAESTDANRGDAAGEVDGGQHPAEVEGSAAY